LDLFEVFFMPDRCIRALVSGRVQGVFFRESTRRQALALAIQGRAINLSDGRVEVTACGDSAAIERLIAWLHVGPEYASVSQVVVEELPQQSLSGFTTG
jgi:acylphosphatase